MRRRIRELIETTSLRETTLRCAVECDGARHRVEWTPAHGLRFIDHPGGVPQLEVELLQLDADRALAELSGVMTAIHAEGCCAMLLLVRQRAYGKAAVQLETGPRKLFARMRGLMLARARQREEE